MRWSCCARLDCKVGRSERAAYQKSWCLAFSSSRGKITCFLPSPLSAATTSQYQGLGQDDTRMNQDTSFQAGSILPRCSCKSLSEERVSCASSVSHSQKHYVSKAPMSQAWTAYTTGFLTLWTIQIDPSRSMSSAATINARSGGHIANGFGFSVKCIGSIHGWVTTLMARGMLQGLRENGTGNQVGVRSSR